MANIPTDDILYDYPMEVDPNYSAILTNTGITFDQNYNNNRENM
jgi:hypothetical protein